MVYQFQSMLILQESPMLMLLMPVDVPMVLVWVGVMLIVVEDPVSIFERVPHSPKLGKRKWCRKSSTSQCPAFDATGNAFRKTTFNTIARDLERALLQSIVNAPRLPMLLANSYLGLHPRIISQDYGRPVCGT
jgi:hypothetical protein